MRSALLLALSLALTLLMPASALGQGASGLDAFARPFQYTDIDGTGTLTITPVSTASTRFGYQQIVVTLVQNFFRYSGAGVYHSYRDDGVDAASAVTLVSFTLLGGSGQIYFFQGQIGPGPDFRGSGTYFLVDRPQTIIAWQMQPSIQTQPRNEAIINYVPELAGNWDRFVFSEALNGFYWGTDNTRTEVTATATWSGKMLSGSYTVEVFLPSRFVGDLVSRPKIATYQIAAVPPVAFRLDQNLNQSGWVRLGNYRFEGSYRIVLSNETGEEPTTERVVASAVRLTPVAPP
jgi:hypothetical protein